MGKRVRIYSIKKAIDEITFPDEDMTINEIIKEIKSNEKYKIDDICKIIIGANIITGTHYYINTKILSTEELLNSNMSLEIKEKVANRKPSDLFIIKDDKIINSMKDVKMYYKHKFIEI